MIVLCKVVIKDNERIFYCFFGNFDNVYKEILPPLILSKIELLI